MCIKIHRTYDYHHFTYFSVMAYRISFIFYKKKIPVFAACSPALEPETVTCLLSAGHGKVQIAFTEGKPTFIHDTQLHTQVRNECFMWFMSPLGGGLSS